MVSRKNTLMAVFAVALMLGCGIIPLFSSQSADGAITVTQNDQSAEGMTLSDIIEKIRTIGDAESFELGDMMFVKVDDEEMTKVQIPQEIGKPDEQSVSSNAVIGAGEYAILGDTEYGYSDYTFTNSKYIEIMEGGKLVFFPLDSTSTGFSFTNTNDDKSFDYMVLAHNGSMISVFGVTFMISFHETGQVQLKPIRLGYSSEEGKSTGDKPKLTATYSYTDGKIDMMLKLNYVAKLYIFDAVFDGDLSAQETEFFKMNGEASFDQESKVLSISQCTVDINSRHGSDTMKCTFVIDSLVIGIGVSKDGDKITNDIAVDLKLHIIEFEFNIKDKGLTIKVDKDETGKDPVYISGKFNVKMITDIKEFKRNVQISTAKSIELNLDNLSVIFKTESGATGVTIAAKDISLRVDSLNADYNEVLGVGTKSISNGTVSASIALSISETKVNGVVIIISIDLIDIKDFALSTSVSANLTDAKNWTVKADKISVAGTIAGVDVTAMYDLGIEAKVTAFQAICADGDYTYKGNAYVTVSVTDNGLVRTLVVSAENAKVIQTSKGSYDVEIGRAYINNGLPLKNIFKYLEQAILVKLMDNMEIELEIKNLKYNTSEHIYSADSMWFHYRNFSISDDVYVSSNGAVKYAYDAEIGKYVLSCDSITGYLKDRNADREQFSIENAELRFSKYVNQWVDYPSLIFNVYICKGTAVFGKGYLPVYLHVMKDVDFTANGLSAYKFSFEKDNAKGLKGTISIDTTDGIYYTMGKYTNVRKIYYDYDASNDTSSSIYIHCLDEKSKEMGCTVYIDISDFSKGRLVANNNYLITQEVIESSEKDSKGIKYIGEIAEYKSVDFEININDAHLRLSCEGDGPYVLTVDGVPFGGYMFNEIVYYLHVEKEGAIGFTDGSGKTFIAAEDGSVAYTMPARNVDLVSVYEKEVAQPASGGEETLEIDVRGGEVAHISGVSTISSDEVKTVNIIVDGATISMSKETYNTIVDNISGTDLYIKVSEMEKSNNVFVQDAIDGKSAYDISFCYYDSDDKALYDVLYTGSSVFEVTVKVKVSGEISGFKATYVNEHGQTESVGVKSYKSLGSGVYEVTLVANHFSTYAVEPVMIDQSNAAVIAVLAAVAIGVCAVGIALIGIRRKEQQ